MARRRQLRAVGAHTYDHQEAPLVATPTPITGRALERLGAGTLYTLLHLETLTAEDLPSLQQSAAEVALSRIEDEHQRWRDLEAHLLAAIATAQEIPKISEHGLRVTLPTHKPIEIKMLDVFGIFASAAEHTAKRFMEVDLGGGLGALPGKLANARRMASLSRSRRIELTNKSVRHRLSALLGALQGWPPGDVAELIVASQRDWNPPPFKLAPRFAFSADHLDSRDRGLAGRARQQRGALLQWIRDQLKALDQESKGERSSRRRNRET